MNWYDLEPPTNNWLVDGLITSDGGAMFCGKPKAGKSTLARSLVTAIIKSRKFIGRNINIPQGTGRVLYIHLDRKDQAGRVAQELRQLGITKDEAPRLTLRTAQELPNTYEDRLQWLQKEVTDLKSAQGEPHLIVIDLLWQFVVAKNNNDYNAVLDGINKLQKSLADVSYQGAHVVTLHGRKAESGEDTFDGALGSTGQRGSFATGIFVKRYRKEGIYTIESDQTYRGEHGEIPETILTYINGEPVLGTTREQFSHTERISKQQEAEGKVLSFIQNNPCCDQAKIRKHLKMSSKTLGKTLNQMSALLNITGEGKPKDPYRYSADLTESSLMEVKNV